MASSTSRGRHDPGEGFHLDTNIHQDGFLSTPRRSPSAASSSTSDAAMKRIRESGSMPQVNSSSSHTASSSTSTRVYNRATQRVVRTLPPWISSYEDDEDILVGVTIAGELPTTPPRAHNARRNYSPSSLERRTSRDGYVDLYEEPKRLNEKKPDTGFFGHKDPVRGRKWDHVRDGDPVILQSGILPTSSLWNTYMKSSQYGGAASEDAQRVDDAFLSQQTPGYERPWRGDLDGANDPEKLSGLLRSKKKRHSLLKRWQNILLVHPLVPLVFRLIVIMTSTIALGISGSVYHLSRKYGYSQNPSTTMAIVVDVVAIPYIVYVTWDEYRGKPLGLRPPREKIRLVLLDVFFIIFESANLALAFAALTDIDGSCKIGHNGSNLDICSRVKALCGILMCALIAWSMTFAASIFRLVERVGGREELD